MFRKLSTMAIVAIMLFVSISMVSFNVSSENVPGPFADRSNGYPTHEIILDQVGDQCADVYPVTSALTRAQIFIPSMTGELSSIDVMLSKVSISTVTVSCQIRPTIASSPQGIGSDIASEVMDFTLEPYGGIFSPQWFRIEFATPPTLTMGQEYAIVLLWGLDDYNWDCLGNYPSGDGFYSPDGGNTWMNNGGEPFGFRTYMGNGLEGLKKVAWHPNGKYALAVAGSDTVYRYDREITTWSVEGTPNTDYVFNDIVWDDYYSEFYLVGQNVALGRAGAYKYDGTTFTDLFSTTSASKFYSVDVCGGYGDYNFLAVGEDGGGYGYAAWHHDTTGWVEINTGWTPAYPEQLNDVAWNQRDDVSSTHYAVGVNDDSDGFIYRFNTGSTVATMLYEQDTWSNELEPGYAISWNPQWSMGGNYDYALIGTEQYYGYGNCYKFDGMSAPSLISKATYPIYDIGWHPDGELAVLVGGNPGDGKVYHHNRGIDAITDMTGQIPGSPDIFYGVAVKGPSSPSSAIIIGPSGSMGNYVDASDTGTQITVNAAYPHLYWIRFNDTSHNSRIEQQVPPDDWYEFSLAANYSQGWTNCEVIIQAWYDNGAVGVASTYPAENEINRCLAFTLHYDAGTGTYTIPYPDLPEFTIAGFSDVNLGGIPGEEIHEIRLDIKLGAQTRSANGDSFGSGDADTDSLKNNALQDANSWDFNITVRDAVSTSASNSLYSEFGIDKVVAVSVTGNPYGNAPPGSSDVLLSNPSQITYSANTNYWVNASIPNLLENGAGPANIPATYVAVANANVFAIPAFTEIDAVDYVVGRAFLGADQAWCVWGNRSQGQSFINAPSNGTVSFGPYGSDYNAGWTNAGLTTTQLNWWITVPGATAEGIYWATITITIESEG